MKKGKRTAPLKAVDFFCSGGGMTSGFIKAGIKVLGGIDIDLDCKDTYIKNNPGTKFLHSDVKKLKYTELVETFRIRRNDDRLIFIGCSPCQYWSKIKTDKSKSEESKNLLNDFQRFVKYFMPGYIVVENVPGILSKIEESPLGPFLDFLKKNKYNYSYKIINASHYGVPQTRRRFVLIASRVTNDVKLPAPDTNEKLPTVRAYIGDKKLFKPITAGHRDLSDFAHTASGLSSDNIERLLLTPENGGTRLAWKDTQYQLEAYKGKDDAFQDIYGRMYWDKPAPTITTKFFSITNGRFGHPEQTRGISLREGATLQTFDKNYVFYAKSIAKSARLIGNAVPPELSKRIAEAIKKM